MKRIVAIIPSINRMGWAVLEDHPSGPMHVASHCYTTDSSLPTASRVLKLSQFVAALIRDYAVTEIVLEQVKTWPARGKVTRENLAKASTAFDGIRGVVSDSGLSFREISRHEWGGGKISEEQHRKVFIAKARFIPSKVEQTKAFSLAWWALAGHHANLGRLASVAA